MGIVIYGTQKSIIGIDDILRYCPCCEADSFADMMVSSNYFHFYFLPLFPVSKEVDLVCQKCGLKSYGIAFNAKTIKNYETIKSFYKHPWYTYIFLSLTGLLILLAAIL